MSGFTDAFGKLFADKGSAKLTKLRIVAFEKAEQDKGSEVTTKDAKLSADLPSNVFEAYYNPSTFSTTYGIGYDSEQPIGTMGKLMKFKEYNTTTYSFDLLLDGTGASAPVGTYKPDANGKVPTVSSMIQRFLNITYEYIGSAHRPAFLRLEWGDSSVSMCVLASATVKSDLFNPDGSPLRATITCGFTEYYTEALSKAKAQKQSPDMTHIRVVQQGDRLPLMCERIYGDANLYLQVARYNNIANYRNLVPGQKIYFPPLLSTKS